MGIYIKGITMPKNCMECPFSDHEAWCLIPGDPKKRYYCPTKEISEDCPLVEVPEPHPTGEWLRMSDLSEKDDDRYKCSHCGNVVHYKSRMDLYTFNSWCGRCGSDNSRHTTIIEWEEDAPTVIEVEGE